MKPQFITDRELRTLPATLILHSFRYLDEAAQAHLARKVLDIIQQSQNNAWLKSLATALLDAIQTEVDERAAEDAWLEREESRDRYVRGIS